MFSVRHPVITHLDPFEFTPQGLSQAIGCSQPSSPQTNPQKCLFHLLEAETSTRAWGDTAG